MSRKVLTQDQEYQSWQAPDVDDMSSTGNLSGNHMLTARQLEQLQKQAYDEAYAEGLAKGVADAQAVIAQRVAQLDGLMQTLHTPFAELDDQVENEMVELCIALVKQLVRRELKSAPDEIVAVVREAVLSLPVATRDVRVHLHPEDASLVREALSVSDKERHWELREDPVIGRGGCRVVTESSQIDATLESRIAQVMTKVFGGARATDSSQDTPGGDDPQ